MSRVVPFGVANSPINTEALEHYEDVISTCLEYGVTPIVTLMHVDNPVLVSPGINLRALSDDELAYINGTCDFYAIDAYISQFASPAPCGVAACAANTSHPLFPTCATLSNTQLNGWAMGARSNAYSYIAPQYVRQQLGYVWNTFRPSGIMVTEFGFPVYGEYARDLVDQQQDVERSLYYLDFLAEALRAVHEDGVNFIGALAWSFADNNEFGSFENQYGLQAVNRTDGLLTRHFKRSIFDLVDFFNAHVSKT